MTIDPRVEPFLLKQFTATTSGYLRGRFKHPKLPRKAQLFHRAVWTILRGPIPPKHHVHHLNGDRHDNRLENLTLMPASDHMRESNLGVKKPGTAAALKGRPKTALHRARIRRSLTGVKKSPEHVANFVKARWGREVSR